MKEEPLAERRTDLPYGKVRVETWFKRADGGYDRYVIVEDKEQER